jgi:hypothetical protein
MTISAISVSVTSASVANGGDGFAIIQALQDARGSAVCGVLAAMLTKAKDESIELQALSQLHQRLASLQKRPDGMVILGDLSSGQAISSGYMAADTTAALNAAGMSLSSQTWLVTQTRSVDSSGKVTTSATTLQSPSQIASIRSQDQQVSSGAVDEYKYSSGSTTNYVDISNGEGEVLATATAVATLSSQVDARISSAKVRIADQTAAIDSVRKLHPDSGNAVDRGLMDDERALEDKARTEHVATVMQDAGYIHQPA